jgi:hypothetical protein
MSQRVTAKLLQRCIATALAASGVPLSLAAMHATVALHALLKEFGGSLFPPAGAGGKGRTHGSVVKVRPESDVRAKLWQSMRVLLRFDIAQLVVTTEAKRSNAQDYVSRLVASGYLRQAQKANPSARRGALYQLVRDTGPRAPITRKTGATYDPNNGETYHYATGARWLS